MKFARLVLIFASFLVSVSSFSAPVLAQNSTLQACRSNMFGKITNSCLSVPIGTAKITIQTEVDGQVRVGFVGDLGFAINEIPKNGIQSALGIIGNANSLKLPDGTQIPVTHVKVK